MVKSPSIRGVLWRVMTLPVVHKAEAKASTHVHQRRRQIVVNLAYKFRALFPVLVCVGLLLVLTLALVWLPMHRQIAADPNPMIRALLAAQLFRIEMWLAPLLVLSGSLAAIVALLRSQRVAGPIKRLREGLARLAVGDPEPLTFRRRDEFRDLEAPFAGAVSRMQQLTRGRLEMLRFLRHNLEGLAQRAKSQDLSAAELHESLAVLLRDVDAEMKKLQMKA